MQGGRDVLHLQVQVLIGFLEKKRLQVNALRNTRECKGEALFQFASCNNQVIQSASATLFSECKLAIRFGLMQKFAQGCTALVYLAFVLRWVADKAVQHLCHRQGCSQCSPKHTQHSCPPNSQAAGRWPQISQSSQNSSKFSSIRRSVSEAVGVAAVSPSVVIATSASLELAGWTEAVAGS